MCPFDVLVESVPDSALGGLLTAIDGAGFREPVITATSASSLSKGQSGLGDLPHEWQAVGERSGESYRWPEYREHYSTYAVYMAQTADGPVHVALGHAVRENKWGRDRRYVIAFLSAGAPVTPLVELLEADDYEQSREYVSVIRGMGGGRKMYGAGDTLPEPYDEHFETALYSDRIDYHGVWNKVVVAIGEDDVDGMCNHALLQARRRGDL